MTDKYTCAACGRTFGKKRTDDEAMAEAEAIFGDLLRAGGEEPAVVCDDCFKAMQAWKPISTWRDEVRRGLEG